MRIKWLHLSDIHFNFKNYDSHELREDFLNRIKLLCQNEPFTHLFLTGDLLFRNNQADPETVGFIKKLIGILQLPDENVVVVPGNHDHDRNAAISQIESLPKKKELAVDELNKDSVVSLLTAFDRFDAVYTEVFGSSYYAEYSNPHIITSAMPITVIKLNTAWLDTDSKKSRSLRVGSRQLQLLLSDADTDLQKSLNIAVGHHPLKELAAKEQNRVLDLFQKHNIGIYFCGHSHQANIQIHHNHDVIEIIAPGGIIDNDGFSVGGYVWGIIDNDTNFYKAEIYNWKNGKWCIDSTLPETDDHGIFYFNTTHFPNSTEIVAVDCKTMNGRISKTQLDQSLGDVNYDIHTYCGPYGNPTGCSEESIRDFSNTLIQLLEKDKTVHLYPLAPIPMLLSIGFNLQKSSKLYIHQYDRKGDKWVYNESSDSIFVAHTSRFSNNDALVVSISTSFEIAPELISTTLKGPYDYIEFKSNRIEPGYPLYYGDVCGSVQSIIDVLNPLATKYSSIHLFAAIPAGFAVELGRNLLSSVYQNIYTYQLDKGTYSPAFILNETSDQRDPEDTIMNFSLNSGDIVYIPILGRVPCGPLKEAITDDDKCFPMPESILGNGDYFILKASGDSMIDAGIDDGDYILVKKQIVAKEGDIVVAFIDGETTIKRIHFDGEKKEIVLQPENKKYSAVSYGKVEVQGVAINVIKNLQN